MASWGPLGGLVEASWKHLGGLLGPSGVLSEACWGSGGHLEGFLGNLGGFLGPFGGLLGLRGGLLGLSWHLLGAMLGHLGRQFWRGVGAPKEVRELWSPKESPGSMSLTALRLSWRVGGGSPRPFGGSWGVLKLSCGLFGAILGFENHETWEEHDPL